MGNINKLKPGELICDQCKGNGDSITYNPCSKCLGSGKLDWIENVVGKKYNESWFHGQGQKKLWVVRVEK